MMVVVRDRKSANGVVVHLTICGCADDDDDTRPSLDRVVVAAPIIDQRDDGDIITHTILASVGSLKNQFDQTFPWESVLGSIVTLKSCHLQKLQICGTENNKNMAMPIDGLKGLLTNSPTLRELIFQDIGFSCPISDDVEGVFCQLQATCCKHTQLSIVKMTGVYTIAVQPPPPPALQPPSGAARWLHYSLLVTALAQLPALTKLEIVATSTGYSRPVLTVSAVESIFSAPRLDTVTLQHVMIWGHGSESDVCAALRCHQTLRHLNLKETVFCSDGSILQGLDLNRSVVALDLSASMLHSNEAAGLTVALSHNTSLQLCSFASVRLGVDDEAHYRNLCRAVRALTHHPTLTSLELDRFVVPISRHKVTASSSSATAASLLESVVAVLQDNHVLTEITYLYDAGDCFGEKDESAHVTVEMSAADARRRQQQQLIAFFLDLNRANYWTLLTLQHKVNLDQWIQAMVSANTNGDCLFRMLLDNPWLINMMRTTAQRPLRG